MKLIHKSVIWFSLLTITLSSCDLNLISSLPSSNTPSTSSSSSLSISEGTPSEVFDFFDALSIQEPYFTEHYRLPTMNIPQGSMQWIEEGFTIQSGLLIHPFLPNDLQTSITLEITYLEETYRQSYPITFKSMIDAPYVNRVPELRLSLQGASGAISIGDDYSRGNASIQYDLHGTMVTTSIPSPYGIRLRGHSTRDMPKKSYRLRFDDNTSLLGMKSSKNYILLANYIDHSHIRNATVHYLSRFFPTLYPIDYRFIDLVIDGVYQGQYLMTERVEFHKNRLDIPFDTSNGRVDSGFLMELDHAGYYRGEGQENIDFFLMNGRPYYMKEPNLDDQGYRPEHFQYIRQYIEQVYERLSTQQDVSDLIDIENWIDYFLLQEVSKNVDVGWGSVYMVKAPNGKLMHMPLWDFDLALGNANYIPYGPTGHWGWNEFDKNDFFTLMMKYPAIRSAFKQRLMTFQQTILPELDGWMIRNRQALTSLNSRNLTIWPLNTCQGWCPIADELMRVNRYEDHLDYISDYYQVRTEWMKNNI